MKSRFWLIAILALWSNSTPSGQWDMCSVFRKDYDLLEEKIREAKKETAELQVELRSQLNEEIEAQAERQESEGETTRASMIYYKFRKARLQLERLHDERIRLRGNNCASCSQNPIDCTRCPDTKGCKI